MKLTNMKDIVIYIETSNNTPIPNTFEILSKSREIADKNNEKVIAMVIGELSEEGKNKVIQAGADEIRVVAGENTSEEKNLQVLKNLIEKISPRIVLFPGTLAGKDYTANLAEYFETVGITDATNIFEAEGNLVVTTQAYGGSILNDIKINTLPLIVNARTGSFEKKFGENRNAEVISENIAIDESKVFTKILDIIKETSEMVNLEDAEIIVAGGRGMGSKENFKLVEDLAAACGGVVGATRPAIEGEWVPRFHQIGQSGKIVSPKLYIACGISGAVQHVSGMITSGYIVAINKDEDAAIFDIADVGIVGDATKVIPLLIEKIKEIKK